MNDLKSCLIVVLLALSINGFCQDPEVEVLKSGDDAVSERISVLKSNSNVKHGIYRRYFHNQQVIKGYFKQGKKDGPWEYYSPDGILVAEGKYSNDERAGEWIFYGKRKRLVQKYNYDTKQITHYDIERERKMNPGFGLLIPTEFPFKNENQSAIFIGGGEYHNTVFYTNLTFSKAQVKTFKNIGTIYLAIKIDENGKLFESTIVKPELDPEIRKIILNAAAKWDNWIPAMKDSKPVKFAAVIPMNFTPGIFW